MAECCLGGSSQGVRAGFKGNLHPLTTPNKIYHAQSPYAMLNTVKFFTVCLTLLQDPTSFQVALRHPPRNNHCHKALKILQAIFAPFNTKNEP